MKTRSSLFSLLPPVTRFFVFLVVGAFIPPVQAQMQMAWKVSYNNGITNGNHQALKMALDPTGSICVTGFSANTNGGTGYATLKYAPNGNLLWTSRFDSTTYPSAEPTAIILDHQTNALVTGTAVTLKYDNNGSLVWKLNLNAAAIATDSSNFVCITGVNGNFTTIKCTPEGSNLWMQTFTSVGQCGAQTVNIGSGGEIYVCGYEHYQAAALGNAARPAAIKYNANGNLLWKVGETLDFTTDVSIRGASVDASNNLFFDATILTRLGGYNTYAYSNTGAALWSVYNPFSYSSTCSGLILDPLGSIVSTGQAVTSANNSFTYSSYGTIKLGANGANLWSKIYSEDSTSTNAALALASSQDGSICLTGYSPDTNGTNDIVTIAYDTNGKQLWLQRYTGLGYGAVGNAIAADNNGNVYVAGYESVPSGGTQMVLIKYAPVSLQHQSNGNFLLQAQGSPNQPFDIQATTNLQSWLNLATNHADTNGLLQYLDTNAPSFPYRFYLAIPQ